MGDNMNAFFTAALAFLTALGLVQQLQYFVAGVFFILLVAVLVKVLSR